MINPFIVICKSTNHMVQTAALLDDLQVGYELVPVPAQYGSICNTAIKLEQRHVDAVLQVIGDNGIAIEGVHSYEEVKIGRLLRKQWGSPLLAKLIKKIDQQQPISKVELVEVLAAEEPGIQEGLIKLANQIRQQVVGDVVDIRAAIEFSNYCIQQCNYCGIAKGNSSVVRYRMAPEEILEKCVELAEMGIKTVILQSGEDPWFTPARLVSLIRKIKETTGLRITLSAGEKSSAELYDLHQAGVNNYLLKIETANRDLYEQHHLTSRWEERNKCAQDIKRAGIMLGTGNIVGLPGQTMEHLAEDLLYFQKLQPHMVGIGPFVPTQDTPWATYQSGKVDLTLRMIALTRIILRNVFIPATTALATLEPEGQKYALEAGANTIMLIATPEKYRSNYKIYDSKLVVDMPMALDLVRELGRKLPKNIRV